ncbi:SDR family oxidoreductase [Paenibacillus sp. HN-1]|uniref:SDR family NAD(P)-dependent oxidoreductase n=1 Tax=Paenibacillus TaxID=44249 RepID=UPI001CA99C2E|nr:MULTISPECIES: SDR family oxidoreductase [Paenibacillus]MBY9080754.1 SDR family oxidoreductase [Paenibacillus sp. CGMCC 1.18879]MBY9085254.1 SDR family oxidoreductase [Paenibacillus sinensis]
MSIHETLFAGKRILVTGASSGIGCAITRRLLESGAHVTGTARSIGKLALLQESFGEAFTPLPLDFADPEGLQDFCKEMAPVDGVVHCAGVSEMVPAKLTEYDKLQSIMQVNFLFPASLNNMLLRKKKINNGGSSIFMSSISGTTISNIGMSAYAASKSAISGYIRSVALETAPKIRINSIAPGMIDTNGGMYMDTVNRMSQEEVQKDIEQYPMKRYGTPDDLTGMVAFLLSSESSWITGQTFVVDGGRTLK